VIAGSGKSSTAPKHTSARDPLTVACPRCGATPGHRCLRAPREPDGIVHDPRQVTAGTKPRPARAHPDRHYRTATRELFDRLRRAADTGRAREVAELEATLDIRLGHQP
jgi:hypothetical protein